MLEEIDDEISRHAKHMFAVSDTDTNRQFHTIKDKIKTLEIDILDNLGHINSVKQINGTVKNRIYCLVQGLPLNRIIVIMVRKLV